MDNFIHCFEQPGPDDFILRSCLNIAARDWLEQSIMLDWCISSKLKDAFVIFQRHICLEQIPSSIAG
jgi:hypothetical protein